MFSGKILTAIAASSMVVAPAMAAPVNPASSLSITSAAGPRAGAPMTNASDARGKRSKGGGVTIALILVVGIIAIVVVAATKSNNSNPTSR